MKLFPTPLDRPAQLRFGAAVAVVIAVGAGAASVHWVMRGHGYGSALAQDLNCSGSTGAVSDRTRTVANVPALYDALKASRPGDKIMLSPGAYSQIVIRNVCFNPAVTIASAQPDHPAVLQGLKVAKSAGLHFRDLETTPIGSGDNYAAMRITQSRDIAFSHLEAHGDASAEPGSQLQAILATDTDQFTVEASNFHHLRAGLVLDRDNDVSVVGNRFHELSKGGVEARASSRMKLQSNSFYDFLTAPGVHGDGIQIFTFAATMIAHDIVITGNLVVRGSGTPLQGIFVQDEAKTLPFHNVDIEDNAVIGQQYNGIVLSHATGDVHIRNNVIASWTGANVVRGGTLDYKSWLRLGDLSGATVDLTGNQAQAFLWGLPPKLVSPPPPGNVKLGRIDDRGAALNRKWLAVHGAALGTLPAGLMQELGAGGGGDSTAALSTHRE